MSGTVGDPTLGARHKRYVEVEVIVRLNVPSDKARKRGDKETTRESVWVEPRTIYKGDFEARKQGSQGKWRTLQAAIEATMANQQLAEVWENTP